MKNFLDFRSFVRSFVREGLTLTRVLPLAFLFFIIGSCDKNELSTAPSATTEIQALTVDEQLQTPKIQQAIANGEDFRVVYPTDSEGHPVRPSGCRCFMRVLAVENAPSSPNGGQLWSLVDGLDGDPEFYGRGTGMTAEWGEQIGGMGNVFQPLPSPSLEINPLNINGNATYWGLYKHMFYMFSDLANAPGYEIQTEVVCYGTDSQGNFLSISQPESYDFKWDEGGASSDFNGLSLRPFSANFSCRGVDVKIDPPASAF